MVKDFSSWNVIKGLSEGSGRSKKVWLEDPETHITGLFKYPKINDEKIETYEFISERLAYEIGRLLKITCAKVNIGYYNNEIGSMSYNVLQKSNMSLVEGIALINKKYPNYNAELLYDPSIDEYYSIKMIFNSIESYNIKKEIINMLLFDFLIGNSDRHQSNWSVIRESTNFEFSPLYDNGSSLCSYIKNKDIPLYLGNDRQKFNSLVNSKSRTHVRINPESKKKEKHIEIVKYLHKNEYKDTLQFVDIVKEKINEDNLDEILNEYKIFLKKDKRDILIKKFILAKKELLLKVYR